MRFRTFLLASVLVLLSSSLFAEPTLETCMTPERVSKTMQLNSQQSPVFNKIDHIENISEETYANFRLFSFEHGMELPANITSAQLYYPITRKKIIEGTQRNDVEVLWLVVFKDGCASAEGPLAKPIWDAFIDQDVN